MFKYIKSNSFIAFVFSSPILIIGLSVFIATEQVEPIWIRIIFLFIFVLITESLEKKVGSKFLKVILYFVHFVSFTLLFIQFYIVVLLFLFSFQNNKLILLLFGQV
ncbi:MAG: hypothetical protein IJY61_08150 [Candidatus Gastranaerophilales bacterium]|nr:hypothetical protein [Candidatus Gastranaerophilales bacterium]